MSEKEGKIKLRKKIGDIAYLIAFLALVLLLVNIVLCDDIVYDFEYDSGEVHVLNNSRSHAFKLGDDIRITNSPDATQVSFSELLDFIKLDRTDENEYERDVFDCVNYAETFHDNAEEYGIRAGFVAVWFDDGCSGHAFNVFNTTDKGIVFVDVTKNDYIVRELKIGSPIKLGNAFLGNFRDVKRFEIYW